jgi:AraC-like DNA-binding protein
MGANGVATAAPMASAESRRSRLGETAMSAREYKCSPQGLQTSQELATLAQYSGYRVKSMACELGRTRRWLEIHFQQRFGLTPHAWLVRLRVEEMQKQARTEAPAKVLCQGVGLADGASFCHALKRCTGYTLRELRTLGQKKCSHNDIKNNSPPTLGTGEGIGVEKSGCCQHVTLTKFSRRPASSEVKTTTTKAPLLGERLGAKWYRQKPVLRERPK